MSTKWERVATATIDGAQWVLRTDKRAGVLTRGVPGPDEQPMPSVALDSIAVAMFAATLHPADRDALLALRIAPSPTCDDCNATGLVDCDECDGTGETECECRCGDQHESDCENCNGKAKTECPCVGSGKPRNSPVPVRFGSLKGAFDRRLLTRVLDSLPDEPITLGTAGHEAGTLLVLRAGEAWAVQMPLHKNDDAPVVEVFAKAVAG